MKLKVLFAFAIVYIVWGSTFTAIKVGLDSFPPIALAGARFILAGSIFLAFSRLRDFQTMRAADIRNEMQVGLLLNLGNAGVCWAQMFLPSGVAALIVGAIPLLFMLFNWIGFEKKVPHVSSLLAILLGVTGIALISQDQNSAVDWKVLTVLILANCAWVLGSLKFKMSRSELSYFPRAAVQLISGGTFLIIFSRLFGEDFSFDRITSAGVGSVVFLALAGTVLAYTAYSYMLKNTTTELASTYALVNPLVALLLGIMFLGESLSPQVALSALLILVSVILTLYGEKLFRAHARIKSDPLAPSGEELGPGG